MAFLVLNVPEPHSAANHHAILTTPVHSVSHFPVGWGVLICAGAREIRAVPSRTHFPFSAECSLSRKMKPLPEFQTSMGIKILQKWCSSVSHISVFLTWCCVHDCLKPAFITWVLNAGGVACVPLFRRMQTKLLIKSCQPFFKKEYSHSAPSAAKKLGSDPF